MFDTADVDACSSMLALDAAFKEPGPGFRQPVQSSLVTSGIGPRLWSGPGGM
ncbi:MAG: hypothetical protein VYD81_07030 [Planctomycetota bacterium]|nr:hypothetical protein [Planctomycetota bacterium]